MIIIVKKPLPHKVGTADIASAELKRVVMLLMENIVSLKMQLEAVQTAVTELQNNRKG